MDSYSKTAMERAMKIQEVILRAMAKKITWWQAAEILGFSDRHLRRVGAGIGHDIGPTLGRALWRRSGQHRLAALGPFGRL